MKTLETYTLTFAPQLADAADGPRRFSGIAYSGGLIPAYGPFGDAVIDLASLRLPAGSVFALVDHDPTQRAGRLTASLQGYQLHVSGELFAATEAGREVAALFAEGAPWQLSVGIAGSVEVLPAPAAVDINGQQLTVKAIFRDASLREVSFVPVGADPATAVSTFAQLPEEDTMDPSALAALTAEIAALKDQVVALTTERDAAHAALAKHRAELRHVAITELSAQTALEISAEQRAVLITLSDADYQVMAGMMTARPAAPEHLFSEQATTGAAPTVDFAAKILSKMTK